MHIHFSAVCGTAMGNVALMIRAMGHRVTGSDENVYPPMSDLLSNAGIHILKGFDPANLQPAPDLVVIGNKLSRGNPEVEATLDRKLNYTSLPELLKNELIRGRRSVVVTGTHGKTTTSALAAWTLFDCGLDPNFMIGGVPGNFDAGWRYAPESDLVVLEGDEYDTAFFDKRSKFVHYLPEVLLLNNIEFDHADIFASLDDIMLAFRRLVNIVPSNGLIVANGDDANVESVARGAFTPVRTFGLGERCDVRAVEIEYEERRTMFTVNEDGQRTERVRLPLLGDFNVQNALGVWTIARHLGADPDAIASAFERYVNVRRRLEKVSDRNDVIVYDDFAHHPTAVRETLRAVRRLHPGRRVRAIFEPRSNTTRRRVFQEEMADAFVDADDVVLSQIDRLEELAPEERLDPDLLARTIARDGRSARFLPDVDAIAEHIVSTLKPGDIIVVMSNGSFGGLIKKLTW